MRNDESKATKYDWSNVPEEVRWLAMDKCGQVFGYIDKPVIHECHDWWHLNYMSGIDITGLFNSKPSDWRESLEQRPSPCAQCPNVGHKTCCCEVR